MNQYSLKELKEILSVSGRTYWDAGEGLLYLSYSCSAVAFSFTGTLLLCSLKALCGQEPVDPPSVPNGRTRDTWPVVGIVIDGNFAKIRKFEIHQEESIVLFQSQQTETHTIRIVKLTENHKTFLAIARFDAHGQLAPCEKPEKKKLLLIGDSITCGFGNLSTDEKRGFYASEEDGLLAYGVQAGELLGMDTDCLCLSGTTLEKHDGFRSPYSICDIYPYTDRILEERLGKKTNFQRWMFQKSRHDYIVINIGTNDAYAIVFGKEECGGQKFEDAYYRFLETVRQTEGTNAEIICALGPMQYFLFDHIVNAVARWRRDTGDQKVSTLKFLPLNPILGIGAGGHPNAASHQTMARELAQHIGGLMHHAEKQ